MNAPTTLERFALRVAGPRDAVINLAINTAIPWWFLHQTETTPIVGPLSMMTLLTPMAFLLTSIVIFFGYFNGVVQRKMGLAGPPLAPETPWAALAIRRGVACGTLAALATAGTLYALHLRFPEGGVPSNWMIVGQGTSAALAAYILQVLAVLQTRKL
jgi:hypothetical protein